MHPLQPLAQSWNARRTSLARFLFGKTTGLELLNALSSQAPRLTRRVSARSHTLDSELTFSPNASIAYTNCFTFSLSPLPPPPPPHKVSLPNRKKCACFKKWCFATKGDFARWVVKPSVFPGPWLMFSCLLSRCDAFRPLGAVCSTHGAVSVAVAGSSDSVSVTSVRSAVMSALL